MGAEQAKLLDAGEKLTRQLQEITTQMGEISQQNQKLLTERKEELRQLKGVTSRQVVPQVQIGSISEFDSKYKWSHWYERFEFFCTVNNVSQEKKVPLFLMMIGNEAYSLLRNLCASEDLKTKSTIELSKIMKDHLEPECNVITERYNFKERKQSDQEKIKDYVASLKSLSIKCNFENLETCLRDQFLWGLKNEIIKRRLLNEVNLTFKRAVEIATSMESEAGNIRKTNDTKDTASGDNAVKNSKTQTKNKITCYCCGKPNHTRNYCVSKNNKCHQCGIIGHLEVVCPEKRLLKDNKNNDKYVSTVNDNILNTCTRDHVTDDRYHLGNTSPMYDRDNVNGFSTSIKNSQRSSITNKCSYCQYPIQTAGEIWKLNCQHPVHKNCYDSFKNLMKCQACNV